MTMFLPRLLRASRHLPRVFAAHSFLEPYNASLPHLQTGLLYFDRCHMTLMPSYHDKPSFKPGTAKLAEALPVAVPLSPRSLSEGTHLFG